MNLQNGFRLCALLLSSHLYGQLCSVSATGQFCYEGCCISCVFVTCDEPEYNCQYWLSCCGGNCMEGTGCQ